MHRTEPTRSLSAPTSGLAMPTPHRKIPPALLVTAKALYEQGATPAQIAPEVRRNERTVREWAKRYRWEPASGGLSEARRAAAWLMATKGPVEAQVAPEPVQPRLEVGCDAGAGVIW